MPTIIPLTTEAVWLLSLQHLPAWEPPLRPTVVLAPHPDDETLGAGGLIARLSQRGIPVTIIAITDGEAAYLDEPGLAETRIHEQATAAKRLGVATNHLRRLNLPDGKVADYEESLLTSIEHLVEPDSHLIAPWTGDFHPDHEATGRVAAKLAKQNNLQLTSYLFWTWHRGSPETLKDVSMVSLPLSEEEQETKRRAIAAHASQLQHPDGQPILSADLLAPVRRSFEVYIRP